MASKKSMEVNPTALIVGFIVLLLAAGILIFIFRTYVGKETNIIGEQIDSFGDCDCDGVSNFLDKCPCIPFREGEENGKYGGCPTGQDPAPCNKQQCDAAKTTSFRCAK